MLKISSMRFAGSPESGSRARYMAFTSHHSMPRGPDPLGASTLLVYLAPDFVTIVTVPPQLQAYWTSGGEGSASTRLIRRATAGLWIFSGVAWTQEKSLSATA